eukprot:319961-Prymnesium_polylepis.1
MKRSNPDAHAVTFSDFTVYVIRISSSHGSLLKQRNYCGGLSHLFQAVELALVKFYQTRIKRRNDARAISAVEISCKPGDRAGFDSRLIFFQKRAISNSKTWHACHFVLISGPFTVTLFPGFHSRTGGGSRRGRKRIQLVQRSLP